MVGSAEVILTLGGTVSTITSLKESTARPSLRRTTRIR